MKIGFVWADNSGQPPPKHNQPYGVTVGMWAKVWGENALGWVDGKRNIPDLSDYDCLMVNQLGQYTEHIRSIKRHFPSITVMAMPDTSIDLLAMSKHMKSIPMLFDRANMIGCRTRRETSWWQSFTGRKAYWMPSPIGPKRELDQLIVPPDQREDRILLIGHTMEPFAEMFNWATVKEISRFYRGRFVMFRPNGIDRDYASHLGIDVEFRPRMSAPDFVREIAKSRMTIDLYPRHSIHRHIMMAAALKVPFVASNWTDRISDFSPSSPMDTRNAALIAQSYLDGDENLIGVSVEDNYARVYADYSLASCRKRAESVFSEMHGRDNVKKGYVFRVNNDYTDKNHAPGDIWQLEVYRIARQYGSIYNMEHVFDLGCGDGHKLVDEMSQFNRIGVEFGKNFKYVNDTHADSGVTWLEADLEGSSIEATEPERTMMICADVVEHIFNLENLVRSMQSAAMSVISTPDRDLVGGADGPPKNERHVREWNFNEFRDWLVENGFIVISMEHVRSSSRSEQHHTICAVVQPIQPE